MNDLLPFEQFERKIIVRKEGESDPLVGSDPLSRTTSELVEYGIINIDKPKGPTSHQVSDYLQRVLGIEKAGHSGTLDPMVSGCLPIALGRATRISQALLKSGKEYIAIMHLHQKVDEITLRKACESFVGEINQLPPIKSAVKREIRKRSVYYLNILEIDDKDVLMKVGCEAGTYIRKLLHDIGKKIGCGAHMAELRRTKAGPFDISTLVTLQDLTDAFHYWKEKGDETKLRSYIQPVENGIAHLPKIWVFDQAVSSLCHGIDLKVPGVSKFTDPLRKGEMVALLTLKGELIALGVSQMDGKELSKLEKGICATTDKVFMDSSVYKSRSIRSLSKQAPSESANPSSVS